MNRKTLTQLACMVGTVLALMLAGGAPNDIGVRVISTLVGGM